MNKLLFIFTKIMLSLPKPKYRPGSLVVKELLDKRYGYIRFIKITEMEYSGYHDCWIYYSVNGLKYFEDELREATDYERGTYF